MLSNDELAARIAEVEKIALQAGQKLKRIPSPRRQRAVTRPRQTTQVASSVPGHLLRPIDPLVLIDTGTGAVAWTTFDASPYVPAGSSAVLLALRVATGQDNQIIELRRDSSAATIVGIETAALASQDDVAGANIVPFFMDSARSFQYQVTGPGVSFWNTWSINLIGYWGPS